MALCLYRTALLATFDSSLRVHMTYGMLGSIRHAAATGHPIGCCRHAAAGTQPGAPNVLRRDRSIVALVIPPCRCYSEPALAERPSAAAHVSSVDARVSNTTVRCRTCAGYLRTRCTLPSMGLLPAMPLAGRCTHAGAGIVPFCSGCSPMASWPSRGHNERGGVPSRAVWATYRHIQRTPEER
jgi:hypothetical protein